MGLIENGAVSGVLPESECFAVHYPGYPSSISRAVETLGGLEEIAKKRSYVVRRAESRPENRNESRLELRFRPEDPYCHPAFGDLRPCRGLLLKISKKKKKKKKKAEEVNQQQQQPQQQSCSDDAGQQQCDFPRGNEESQIQSVQLSASIVARAHQAYYFDGLADYQFVVPVHAAKSRQKKRRWADVEPHFEKGGLMDIEQDELIMLVPKLFSPKDMPDEILLRQSVTSTSKQQQQQAFAEYSWEMDIEPCLKLSFEIENIPGKVNWEGNISKDSREWERQMAVSKLFDERPIWPRWSLLERLLDDSVGVSYNQLRRLLTRSGYYFSTGPFGQFWIRKGYDPRTDPESRIYQRVEFRLRDLPSFGGVNLNTEYGIGDFGMPTSNRKFSGNSMHHGLKQTWKDICCFQEFPFKSCTLQLFELDDDYIQQQIRDLPQQTTCTHSTGWFSRTTFELLCLRVKIRFLSVFPKKGAEKLLKSLRDRFEKLKKLEILNRIHGRNVEDLDVNKDTMSQTSRDTRMKNSDVGPADDGEAGCAAHEADDDLEEEEDEEEELDEYESQPVGGEDGSFSPSASSHLMGENINISYLQELLCNKTVEEGGDQPNVDVQGAEASDSEYQIYEQDSDDSDNYFDEDDDDS